ncbi:MAG: T9SS type A sorting domain-containing protein [Saprospiraceae bacterium]|nr:T9SS type A sorting domain-containing protein [Saprospiraceae bacterium]
MRLFLLIIFLLFSVIFKAFSQQIIYVNIQAAGLNNGSSWADAYTDLHLALDAAQAGDAIWVAEGMYRTDTLDHRERSFVLKSGVKLYGGFCGTESSPAARVPDACPSVLTGDIGIPGDSTDNAYNVVYAAHPDAGTVLDGFTVTGGNADFPDPVGAFDRKKNGGGLLIEALNGQAFMLVRQCRFIFNTARSYGGGCMVNGNGNGSEVAPLFQQCHFEGNHALLSGGGLARYGAAWVERGRDVDSCVFRYNRAESRGGGLFCNDAQRSDTLQVTGCRFIGNYANNRGGGMMLVLGRATEEALILTGNEFRRNAARQNGSAFYVEPYNFGITSYVEVSNTKFTDNPLFDQFKRECIFIDLLSNDNDSCVIKQLTFVNQDSIESCMSITRDVSSININDVVAKKSNFINFIKLGSYTSEINNAVCDSVYNLSVAIEIAAHNRFILSNTQITNCTWNENANLFWHIIPPSGPINKILVYNSIFLNNKTWLTSLNPNISNIIKTIKNCTFQQLNVDQIKILLLSSSSSTLSHNYFAGFDSSVFIPFNILPDLDSTNLVGIPPMFRDTVHGDYTLLPCSPLKDAGINDVIPAGSTDIAGQPRIQGPRVDIGCYESSALSIPPDFSVTRACSGQNNGAFSPSAQHGCLPYTYAWSAPGIGSGSDTTGLAPGNYALTVTDSRNQSATVQVVIPQAPTPVVTAMTEPLYCGDPAGGSISTNLNGGTPPVVYAWHDGADTPNRQGLGAGSYQLIVTDSLLCADTLNTIVEKIGNLTLLPSAISPVSCYGGNDGLLGIRPLSAAWPVQYQWAHGDTDSLAQNLTTGLYQVTATDVFGCTGQYSLSITGPDSLQFTVDMMPTTNPMASDGSLNVSSVSGGNPPYTYEWADGATGPVRIGLPTGFYTLTVKDQKGCASTWTFEVKATSGIHEPTAAVTRLYPNPTMDKWALVVNWPASDKGYVAIFDPQGQRVRFQSLQLTVGEQTLNMPDLSDLPNAVYTWRLFTDNAELQGFVVKQ